MQTFLLAFFATVALLWIVVGVSIARGAPKLDLLKNFPPAPDTECPSVSILFAARDEADGMPRALEKFLTLDYPQLEVVAVDDRSTDATPDILEAAARLDPRLKVAHVDTLPDGWLGKPHALQKAFERSTGEWLLFTDADVHFAPDLLRRAISLMKKRSLDHLTLLGIVQVFEVGEQIAMIFFGLVFMVGSRPWSAGNPDSGGYHGVGGFQLVRRSAYEASGTHQRLAMEVVDDMKLGKILKERKFRSAAALAGDAVSVRWHAGLKNLVRGTSKNFFAGTGYRVWLAALHIAVVLGMCVVPVFLLPFARGWALLFALIAVTLPAIPFLGAARQLKAPAFLAASYPLGALLFAWMMTYSVATTLRQGGIVWRGTFYPLKDLKRGLV